ncbi:MAG: hypothetical protein VST64_09780 [Nitrospirota bacterium]|nr:hypothetical protein [Nitrospirota bacterium]
MIKRAAFFTCFTLFAYLVVVSGLAVVACLVLPSRVPSGHTVVAGQNLVVGRPVVAVQA